ncbi:MAG: hypothetical protein D6705_18210 [Deltaproteobacteria bacterium]|nr:MAG: hypothetical protein D6705_18210 [Deltaproteobacteria bacterium]
MAREGTSLPWTQDGPRPRLRRLGATVRRRAGAAVTDGFFRTATRVGRLHPLARPDRHGVEVVRDVPYREDGPCVLALDVYRPRTRSGLVPTVLYLHGGGFRILSKDSHWMMGIAFARRGFATFVVDYRLAPRHRYPAAVDDAAAAYAWVVRHAERYGGDPRRLVVAGESAGANLATVLTLAACYERPETIARRVWDTGVRPVATIAACGMLQVSDPERFRRRRNLPAYLVDRLTEVRDAYLGVPGRGGLVEAPLADPLCLLEEGGPPPRPLPPFFAPVGTRDPLLDDTRRLARAVERLGGTCRASYYPGQIHAFHAFMLTKAARACWAETFEFLEQVGVAPSRPG